MVELNGNVNSQTVTGVVKITVQFIKFVCVTLV